MGDFDGRGDFDGLKSEIKFFLIDEVIDLENISEDNSVCDVNLTVFCGAKELDILQNFWERLEIT